MCLFESLSIGSNLNKSVDNLNVDKNESIQNLNTNDRSPDGGRDLFMNQIGKKKKC